MDFWQKSTCGFQSGQEGVLLHASRRRGGEGIWAESSGTNAAARPVRVRLCGEQARSARARVVRGEAGREATHMELFHVLHDVLEGALVEAFPRGILHEILRGNSVRHLVRGVQLCKPAATPHCCCLLRGQRASAGGRTGVANKARKSEPAVSTCRGATWPKSQCTCLVAKRGVELLLSKCMTATCKFKRGTIATRAAPHLTLIW